jgi:glycosyltransferase involved in cell wall biosynthesis
MHPRDQQPPHSFNSVDLIESCLRSVILQANSTLRLRIIVADDNSTDGTLGVVRRVLADLQGRHQYIDVAVVISVGDHLGPGHSLWALAQHIRQRGGANDVVVVVGGDDYLLRPDAFAVIAGRYAATKCWMTYGSTVSRFGAQTARPFTWIQATEVRTSLWVYGYPRSFKVHLLRHLRADDFKHSDGSWLVEGSERGMLYRMFEVSGASRVQFIPTAIYGYREHPQNTYTVVSDEATAAQINASLFKPKSVPSPDAIHVIVANWRRTNQLEIVVRSLRRQTGLTDKVLRVHIWNNNANATTDVDDLVWRTEQAGATETSAHFTVAAVHSSTNVRGWGRFEMVRRLMQHEPLDYVLFVDDDFDLPNTFIAGLWNGRKPLQYNGWYGRIFGRSYHNMVDIRSIDLFEITNTKARVFEYVGTGGAIVDASVFEYDKFWRCPDVYRDIEDVWLSFITRDHLGFTLNRYIPTARVVQIRDDDGSFTTESQFFKIKKKKQTFYERLRDAGWRVGNDRRDN